MASRQHDIAVFLPGTEVRRREHGFACFDCGKKKSAAGCGMPPSVTAALMRAMRSGATPPVVATIHCSNASKRLLALPDQNTAQFAQAPIHMRGSRDGRDGDRALSPHGNRRVERPSGATIARLSLINTQSARLGGGRQFGRERSVGRRHGIHNVDVGFSARQPAARDAAVYYIPCIMSELGFSLFETAIGRCGIVWNERGIVAPCAFQSGVRTRFFNRYCAALSTCA